MSDSSRSILPQPRPEIAQLSVYEPPTTEGLRLHANEAPSSVVDPGTLFDPDFDFADALEAINRYPDANSAGLRGALAKYLGVDESMIFVGVGSNEVLLNAALAYGGHQRRACVFQPSYSMHPRQALIAGCELVVMEKLSNFEIDFAGLPDSVTSCDIVFICSPDNPTGVQHAPDDVVEFAKRCRGLVVVDEAYGEFSDATVAGRIGEVSNMMVTRTLSKAFGLAGARIGYAVAHPEVVANLKRVRMPYSVGLVAQVVGVHGIDRLDAMRATVSTVIESRGRLHEGLSRLAGFEVWPSKANFILFRPPDAQAVLEIMRDTGIIIRDMSHTVGCEGCLRVTATNLLETERFLSALGEHFG